MTDLNQELDTLSKYKGISKVTPSYIVNNLRQDFKLREYQKEAVGRFDFYMTNNQLRKKPTQLLYEMATGSGKTLVMAANILWLYRQGYRNFIFFVNSTNIIEKTKDNFLNQASSKYLFDDEVVIDERRVGVREVDNFQGVNEDDINILFTTIQGLHLHLNEPRENSITYEDFEDKRTVLISDEAHHINTLTKSKLNKGEQEEMRSWEGTVNRIFNSNKENVLLEFTATANLGHPAVADKYEDKILYKYPLEDFRKDKFSKEIQLLQTDLPPVKRALQAIVVSQYRRKIAEEHGIALKPVVMFKANYVNPPSARDPEKKVVSEEFRKSFYEKLESLQVDDIEEIKAYAKEGIVEEAFTHFEENNISFNDLIKELQIEFGEERAVSVDSTTDKEENQILVNTLEDKDNEIRAVFAVEALNEGWDVLNLFDIVRLYNTRDAKSNKPGKTTVQEAQLIGRGARYYPFQADNTQEKFKRKYDDDVDNKLRILEELHYHSASNVKYISELKQALVEEGIMAPSSRKVSIKVKDEIKQTPFWEKGILWVNEKQERTPEDIFENNFSFENKEYTTHLYSGDTQETAAFGDEDIVREAADRELKINELNKHVIRSAMDAIDGYDFASLGSRFLGLNSIDEFITNKQYLPGIKIYVQGTQERLYGALSQKDKFEIAKDVLKQLLVDIRKDVKQHKGTEVFTPKAIKAEVENREMKISLDETGDQQRGVGMRDTQSLYQIDLREKSWYVYDENYGTSEEKSLVKFINDAEKRLREEYDEIYLLRNQKLFQLYRFSDGKPVEPDFVLFLKDSTDNHSVHYQLFIEPKGEGFRDKDKWKEEFLQEIEERFELKTMFENKDFKLIGLPFYTEDSNEKFEEKWQEFTKAA